MLLFLFRKNLRVGLLHTAPVTFTIDRVTCTIRYNQESNYIYTIELNVEDKDIRGYHSNIRNRVERFLNNLKDVN
jgi:hypothetical protein